MGRHEISSYTPCDLSERAVLASHTLLSLILLSAKPPRQKGEKRYYKNGARHEHAATSPPAYRAPGPARTRAFRSSLTTFGLAISSCTSEIAPAASPLGGVGAFKYGQRGSARWVVSILFTSTPLKGMPPIKSETGLGSGPAELFTMVAVTKK
jgi:hypothetical protein